MKNVECVLRLTYLTGQRIVPLGFFWFTRELQCVAKLARVTVLINRTLGLKSPESWTRVMVYRNATRFGLHCCIIKNLETTATWRLDAIHLNTLPRTYINVARDLQTPSALDNDYMDVICVHQQEDKQTHNTTLKLILMALS